MAGTVTFDKNLTPHLRPGDRRDRSQAVGPAQRDHARPEVHSSWKAAGADLHYLVMNSETGTSLKIRVLNLPKRELARDLQRAVEFDQSQLFKKIYENEFGTPGGEPYGALIGDYEWTQHPDDIETLRLISNVAAGAFAPFISAAGARHVRLRQLDRTVASRAIWPKIFETAGIRQVAQLPRQRGFALRQSGACRAFWRACRTEPRPRRSTNSIMKKRRMMRLAPPSRWITATTAG